MFTSNAKTNSNPINEANNQSTKPLLEQSNQALAARLDGLKNNDKIARRREVERLSKGTRQIGPMLVTPAMAAVWLSASINSNNRPIYFPHVKRLISDLEAGRYQLTTEPLAFAQDATMLDGQHRIAAVLLSGKAQEFFVALGFDRDVFDVIGQGKARTAGDVLGIKHPGKYPHGNRVPAIATAMNNRGGVNGRWGASKQTIAEQMLFVEEHSDVILWTLKTFGRAPRGVSRACVPGVVARAAYTMPRTKLAQFCRVITSGVTEDREDNCIIKLREYLLHHNLAGHSAAAAAYNKVEYVLYRYWKGLPIKSVIEAVEEYFPLPGEAKFKKLK